MNNSRDYYAKSKLRQARRRNAAMSAQERRNNPPKSRRVVASRNVQAPFSPPETWHEPTGGRASAAADYRVIVEQPGMGYRHVVTPRDVRTRLAKLPPSFLDELEVVHFSRMTRKKQSFPCYGMQWGATLYLYPLEESLTEHFAGPPRPDFFNEARMYGGRWEQHGPSEWTLTWTEQTIRDFYLNNILIHELGHLLDKRNSTYTDRERYAEWFAIEYGYRQTGGASARRGGKRVRRRHHSA